MKLTSLDEWGRKADRLEEGIDEISAGSPSTLKLSCPKSWAENAVQLEEGIDEISAGSPHAYDRIMAELEAKPLVEISASGSEAMTFAREDLEGILKYVRAKWREQIIVRVITNEGEDQEFTLAAQSPETASRPT